MDPAFDLGPNERMLTKFVSERFLHEDLWTYAKMNQPRWQSSLNTNKHENRISSTIDGFFYHFSELSLYRHFANICKVTIYNLPSLMQCENLTNT